MDPRSPLDLAAADLVAVVTARTRTWLQGALLARAEALPGGCSAATAARLVAVADAEAARAVEELTALVATDVDAQRDNPLAVLRRAAVRAGRALAEAGLAPVARDHFEQQAFPEDRYHLVPASWADVHPDLHEPGMMWGAAKAATVLARRRAEGRR